MAKERPVPSGSRKPANTRGRQAAPDSPALPQTAPAAPGPRRPSSGGPSDPRPIAAPLIQGTVTADGSPPHHAGPKGLAGQAAPKDLADHAPTSAARAAAAARAATAARLVSRPLPGAQRASPTDNAVLTAFYPFGRPLPAESPAAAPPVSPAATSPTGPSPTTTAPVEAGPNGTAAGPAPTGSIETALGLTSTGPAETAAGTNSSNSSTSHEAAGPVPAPASPGAPQSPAGPGASVAGRAPAGDGGTGSASGGATAVAPETRTSPSPKAAPGRRPGPSAARRPETVGIAKVPARRPQLPGLQLQPMVHVDDMATAVAFYERLGGEINHGDRDGDWVLMQVGTAQIGLVTRPRDARRGGGTVELNFAAAMPLDRLEQWLREHDVTVVEVARDRDLGAQLHLETPDGMPIKIHQVEPDLMV